MPIRKTDAPRTLYVSRPLLNAREFIAWAHAQGFKQTLAAGDFHVTIAFSRAKVRWSLFEARQTVLRIPASAPRSVEPLGDEGAAVLKFKSTLLSARWREFREHGCSWDYASYHPHVTVSYAHPGLDLALVEPFDQPMRFGLEKFTEVVEDWDETIDEERAG